MSSSIAVILAAHGAGDDSAANAAIRRLAMDAALATGLPIMPAFNLGRPRYEDALAAIDARHIIVVPLMTSAGYFAGEVVPRRFRQTRCIVAEPVGIRPDLVSALAARTARTAAAASFAPVMTTVIVVGHGTERCSTSGEAAGALALAIAELVPGITARAAFLDQEPLLEDAARMIETANVIIVPLLVGGGHHASIDIAARLGINADQPLGVHERAGRRYVFEPPLIDRPELLDAVVACINAQVRRIPIRLGTRRSRLALRQARRAAAAIRRATRRVVELAPFDASGDLDQTTPVEQLPGESPFSDEITAALLRGQIDIATHSLKDLPLEPDPSAPVVAVLQRGPVEEVLVARDGMRLWDLPSGARVGVSCVRRAAQLRRLRPALVAAAIRGPVDARIAQVLSGMYDAAILAAAGLERLGLAQHITQRFATEELTPAAGQGAIALQARADDAAALELARAINHVPTWRAVQAELALARQLEHRIHPYVMGAVAHTEPSGDIALLLRVLAPDGRLAFSDIVRASSPAAAANQAASAVTRDLGSLAWRESVA